MEFLKKTGKILSSRDYPEIMDIDNNDIPLNIGFGSGPQAKIYMNSYNVMYGIDINFERLKNSRTGFNSEELKKIHLLNTNAEKLPFRDRSFNKIIAIDILEHVENPEKLLLEIGRVLSENGKALLTFPLLHDRYTDFISYLFKHFRKKNKSYTANWNPDDHNTDISPSDWLNMISDMGFRVVKLRSSTLFPPLHLYGIPRFWFSNELIHRIDSFFCKKRGLRFLGQSAVCVLTHDKK